MAIIGAIDTLTHLSGIRYRYEPIGYGFEELRDLKLDEQPILIVVNYFFIRNFFGYGDTNIPN